MMAHWCFIIYCTSNILGRDNGFDRFSLDTHSLYNDQCLHAKIISLPKEKQFSVAQQIPNIFIEMYLILWSYFLIKGKYKSEVSVP